MDGRKALVVLAVGLTVIGLPLARSDSGQAQVVVPMGQLSGTIRVQEVQIAPGTAVPLRLELANRGNVSLIIRFVCQPDHDFLVLNGAGAVVWQLHPACDPHAGRVETLAPGESLVWDATWPGFDQQGRPPAGGIYYVYGRALTGPQAALIGPVPLEVTGPTATPGAVDATPTPAVTATATESITPLPTATAQPTPEPPDTEAPFPVAQDTERESRPDVAGSTQPSSCQHLVVWWEDRLQAIRGRFVGPYGPSEPFLIAERDSAAGPPRVAYNGQQLRWLVVWAPPATDSVGGVRGRYVRCGTVEGRPLTIGAGSGPGDQPAVAATEHGFAVVWRLARGLASRDIVGQELIDGASAAPPLVIATGNVAEPAVACGAGDACLVAWTNAPANADHVDIAARMWAPHQVSLGARTLGIATTARNERYPSVAWTGELDLPAYLVTWSEEGEARAAVKARGVYPQANGPLDAYAPGPLTAEVGSYGLPAHYADVTAQGGDFVVAWSGGALGGEDILAARVRLDLGTGQPLAGPPLSISDRPEIEGYPAIADAGRPLALVVWQLEGANGSDIWGRYVSIIGQPMTRVILVGRLLHVGAMVQSGSTYVVRVSRVLSGQFLCSEAVVKIDEPSLAEAGLQPGDEVVVSGYLAPGEGECVLVVGAAGTYLQRTRFASVRLPHILRY